jgi:hypothetical protein
MIRFFFLDVLPPGQIQMGFREKTNIPLKLAEAYFPSVLQGIKDEFAEKAAKRAERVKNRIAELQKKKKELAKPSTKTPAKKAAKK